MTQPASFSDLGTAVRVREIVKKAASKQIAVQVPSPLVGRVISVDVPRLKAMVWFPGDENPVEATLLAGVIPGSWQEQLDPGMTSNTSFAGYGSQVSCQKLNGTLYVVNVLSGGSSSFDLNVTNQVIRMQNASFEGEDRGLYGSPLEGIMSVSVGGPTENGEAIEFGPFTRETRSSIESGWVEMTIKGAGRVKMYEFTMNFYVESGRTGDLLPGRWLRVIPKGETGDIYQSDDWDLDVTVRETEHGMVGDFPTEEIWFRMVKANSDIMGLNGDITIRTQVFQKSRSLDGRERFLQIHMVKPVDCAGYIGFHNSGMPWQDDLKGAHFDFFDRADRTALWGSIEGEASPTGFVWEHYYGGVGHFGIMNRTAYMILPVANDTRISQGPDMPADVEIIYDVATPHGTILGGALIGAAFARVNNPANENGYYFRTEHNADGAVWLKIHKWDGTVGMTELGSEYITGYNHDPDVYLRTKVQLIGTTLRMKCWNPATMDEPWNWQKSVTDSTYTLGGRVGLWAWRIATNTNNNPRVHFSKFIARPMPQRQAIPTAHWNTGPWRSSVLRVAQQVQNGWTLSGGSFIWDGSSLEWTGNIRLDGSVRNRNGLVSGRAFITAPPTSSQIPVYPAGAFRTVSAAGIQLFGGESLWCAIPPGQIDTEMMDYLFIARPARDIGDFDIPEWAVMIATRPSSGNGIRLGNGDIIGAGVAATGRRGLSYIQTKEATAALNLTATPTLVPGMFWDVPVNATNAAWEFNAFTDMEFYGTTANNATVGCGNLYIDNVLQTGQILGQGNTIDYRGTPGQTWSGVLNPKAGAATYRFELRGSRAGGVDAVMRINNIHTRGTLKVFE